MAIDIARSGRPKARDMKNWTGGRLVVERLQDDAPNSEFYHARAHFVGSKSSHGLHFGYLYLFHTDTGRGVRKDGVRLAGRIDTSLLVSRDTIYWTRLDRKRRFLPRGPEGSWDGGMSFISPEVVGGNKMLFYYSGWRLEAGGWRLDHFSSEANVAGIGLATVPLARFVSVEPAKDKGTLTTKPFVAQGRQLIVDADASKAV